MWTFNARWPRTTSIVLALGVAICGMKAAAVAGENPAPANWCEGTTQPIVYPDRVWLRGFALVPPVGQDWCLDGPNVFESSVIIRNHSDNPAPGTELSLKERAHTYYAFAWLAVVDGEVPTTWDELGEFAEAWIKAGAVEVALFSGMGKLVLQPGSDQRITLTQGAAERDKSLGLECVRYDLVQEERDNRLYPGVVLELVVEGYLCLDIGFPEELINIGHSERFIKGERPPLLIMECLKPQADALLKSIWLDVPEETAAVDRLRAAAERGLAQAEFSFGVSHERRKDYAGALAWYRRAAEQGHVGAIHNVGLYNLQGLGTRKDLGEAARWMGSAAASGAALSQYIFGMMHIHGDGVEQDFEEAVMWLRLAVEQGLPGARDALGIAYQRGDGVTRDDVTAYMWFSLAMARLDPGDYRDEIEGSRARLAEGMTPEQIAVGERMAAEWLPEFSQ